MPDTPKADEAMDPKALKRLPRDELDRVAADAGVPDPDDLPNKDAVVEAIQEPNPALAPVAENTEPVERAYTVIGPHIVLGHQPGSEFTALIPAAQEALLIESGHIVKQQTPED